MLSSGNFFIIDLASRPWAWERKADLPSSLMSTGTVDDGDNFIWTFGGKANNVDTLDAIYKYDLANDQWTTLGAVLPFSGSCKATYVKSRNEAWISNPLGLAVFDMATETINAGSPVAPEPDHLGESKKIFSGGFWPK